MTSAKTGSRAVVFKMKGATMDAKRRILKRGDIINSADTFFLQRRQELSEPGNQCRTTIEYCRYVDENRELSIL